MSCSESFVTLRSVALTKRVRQFSELANLIELNIDFLRERSALQWREYCLELMISESGDNDDLCEQ